MVNKHHWWVVNLGGACDPQLPCYRKCYQKADKATLMGAKQFELIASLMRYSSSNTLMLHVNGGTPPDVVGNAVKTLVTDNCKTWQMTININDVERLREIIKRCGSPSLVQVSIPSDVKVEAIPHVEGCRIGITVLISANANVDIVRRNIITAAYIGDGQVDNVHFLTHHAPRSCMNAKNAVGLFRVMDSQKILDVIRIIGADVISDSCLSGACEQRSDDHGPFGGMVNVMNISCHGKELYVGGCAWGGKPDYPDTIRGVYALD